MDTLVTGGAGFIGSHLAAALLDNGHDVVIVDDFSTGRRENVDPRARLVEGDVTEIDQLTATMHDRQIVFHLAADGSVAHSIDDPLATDLSNTHGTLSVLEAARRSNVRRVVFASSCSVYGNATTPPTSEADRAVPESPYAVTKLVGEHYARIYSEMMGVETVALRYFNVFGPRQRADSVYAAVIPKFAEALQEGRPPTIHGDGKQRRDFVFVGDVAAANLLAATAPAARCNGGVFNIGSGVTVDLLDLLATMSDVLGVEVEAEHIAARPGDVRESGADITRARQDLGFVPSVSLRDGLARMLRPA